MLGAAAASAQVAQPAATGIDASGSYPSEVKSCKEGRTGEDRATCLREAGAAQAERKQGQLDKGKANLDANALARCDYLKGDDRSACEARMMGHGQVYGSVAGGGLLREVEIVLVPPGATEVTVQPKTADPVMVLPAQTTVAMPVPPATREIVTAPVPPATRETVVVPVQPTTREIVVVPVQPAGTERSVIVPVPTR
ncbi:hypothetical protein GCM10027034_27740 [Ramlibacter solisilvae]